MAWVEKEIFKELMHFNYVTYIAMQLQGPWIQLEVNGPSGLYTWVNYIHSFVSYKSSIHEQSKIIFLHMASKSW